MGGDGFEEGGAQADRGEAIDLARLWRGLLRRKRWIVGPTLASCCLAVLFVTVVSPRYTGVAKVLLENQENYFTRPEKAVADPGALFDPEGVQSQAETVATTELARKAADKLGLIARDEFNPTRSGNPLALAWSLLSGGRAISAEDRVVEAFLARLDVFPVAKSRVLQIEFVSTDPALAARGANTVAALYLAGQEDAKKSEAKAASAWLSQRIEELRAKVADADAKVEALRANSGLLAGANGMTVPTQQLADMTTQLAASRARQADAIAKAQSLRAMVREGRLDEIPDAAKDESLRRYVEQRVALKAQIALESRTLLPQHPRMKELNGELAGLEGEIRIAAGKSVLGLEDDAKVAAAEVDSLSAALAKQSSAVASGNVEDVRLRALELDAKTARDQLESSLQKYREALAREADNAAPADARVIASASEPRTPTFPKKAPTVLLATLAGLLISAAAVTARVLLLDGDNVLGGAASTGRASASEAEEEETSAPEDAAREIAKPIEIAPSYSSAEELADRLAEVASEGAALTTLFAGEGTDRTLALALTAARRLAKRGRVALVDLGVSQEWLPDTFDREAESGERLDGLAELLDGRATFEEVLHRDLSSSLDVIPAGEGAIATEGLGEALAALASSYDFVVLHASNWRSAEVAAALDAVAVAVAVAPAQRLAGALRRVRETLGQTSIATLGLASAERTAIERAA
jgi:uncharacterized protein involved in exopolysaccharide biosynthesis/Mrp family chromosome partitioning ATPase